jgi:hypothetical protein
MKNAKLVVTLVIDGDAVGSYDVPILLTKDGAPRYTNTLALRTAVESAETDAHTIHRAQRSARVAEADAKQDTCQACDGTGIGEWCFSTRMGTDWPEKPCVPCAGSGRIKTCSVETVLISELLEGIKYLY